MSLNEITTNLPNYPMEELARIRQRLVKQGQKVYDFGTGDPQVPTWEPIRQALSQNIPLISQYPATKGGADLLEAIWGYCARNFAIAPSDGFDVMATNGSKEAIFHMALCLVGRAGGKKTIAYPDPGYPVYRSSALFAGGIPYPIQLSEQNRFQIEPWTLPEEVQRDIAALWINYPHNPTGAILEQAHLEKILNWCEARDVVLLADDCYIDIYDTQWEKSLRKPLTPLTYRSKNIFSFQSLSKRSGMTGYRSGFIVGDSKLMPSIATARANFGVGTPTMLQKAAAVAWADDGHVAERRKIFSSRIDLAYPVFKDLKLMNQKPEATFYLWSKVPEAQDDVEFCLKLAERGVIASPSQWLSEGIKGYMRFALVPTEEDTLKAMQIVRELASQN